MPPDDRATKTDRCTLHGARPSIGRCVACGRTLCLSCAIPVRGSLYGAECLPSVLGPDAPAAPEPPPPPSWAPALWVAGAGFVVAVAGSVLPWTRFGTASGWFGAWGIATLRWSSLSAFAATLGLIVWLRRRDRGGPFGSWILVALAALAAVGAVMHIAHPPPVITHPWLGPWVALAGAAVAAGGSTWAGVRARRTPVPA